MGIKNCIIIYNSTIDINLIIDEFIEKLKKENINYILTDNDNISLNNVINKYNNKENIIITLDTQDVKDEINNILKKESQSALYYHINYNPYIKDFIKLKKNLEKITIEDIIKNNIFKINDFIYNDKIIIGEDIFSYLPDNNSLKSILSSLLKYKRFKKCFSDSNKKDIIYLSDKECGNQFFYFGIIISTKEYNSIPIFNDDNQVNLILIKKLNNKEILKLFKNLIINKKIPEEILKECIIISTNNLKLISNDNKKIYIDDKKSEVFASYELEFVYENKIKIIKKR